MCAGVIIDDNFSFDEKIFKYNIIANITAYLQNTKYVKEIDNTLPENIRENLVD